MSAEAALLMKDDQRIKGLHNYLCNLELDMNLSWMLGCALQSQRKYEKGMFFKHIFTLHGFPNKMFTSKLYLSPYNCSFCIIFEKPTIAIQKYNEYLAQEEALRTTTGDKDKKISEIFVKIQINECLISVGNWAAASAFLTANADCAQPGATDYIKAMQNFEEQNTEGRSHFVKSQYKHLTS